MDGRVAARLPAWILRKMGQGTERAGMKKFPTRSLLYAAVLLYLLVDLKWCHGPLARSIASRHADLGEQAARNGWVAIVNQEPLTRGQLDLAVARHLYQRGQSADELPEKALTRTRRAVLHQLIDDTLIRQYADGEGFTAPEKEREAFVSAWRDQFADGEEEKARTEDQGLAPGEADGELARIWSRKRWLEQRIEPGVSVTPEEVRAWFDAHREDGSGFTEPEKVRARQIFLSTVEDDSEEREQLIREARERLDEEGAAFAEVAKEISEDPRSAKRGGDLGWFSRRRVPGDFAEKVFALEKGEISEPFRTELGWHIVEVTDRQEKRPATFEEVEEEIAAHLRNQRRSETIEVLLEKLRKVAKIELFTENL